MEAEISVSVHPDTKLEFPLIHIYDNPFRPPTPQELRRIGASFECWICGKNYPKDRFGGFRHEKKLCDSCFITHDDWDVGRIIQFDQSKKRPGKAKTKLKEETHRKTWRYQVVGGNNDQ